MSLKTAFTRLKAQYDKLIASIVLLALLVSLLYLAVHVGMIRSLEKSFVTQMDGMKPKHPVAKVLDTESFEAAIRSISEPFHADYASWTNALTVPEERVACVDCRMPIPFAAEVCVRCQAQQPADPETRPTYDGDGDTMWDKWEVAHGLDPSSPADAGEDFDGDGFSNLAEFRAQPKTSPSDPESYPPPEAELYLTKITADPFRLRFKSSITMPGNVMQFGINTRRGQRTKTYFVKLNDSVEGFTVDSYRTNFVQAPLPGSSIAVRRDKSVLTLKQTDKTIQLVKDEEVQRDEYSVDLFFRLDKSSYSLKIGSIFKLKGKEYLVIGIDPERRKVVLKRLHDGKQLDILEFPDGHAGSTLGQARPAPSGAEGEGSR